MTALDPLSQERRWVAWRNERRGEKLTKVPYSPLGRKAKADDPSTWGTRAEAEARAAKIINGLGGGVGYELGDLGEDTFIAGIDLDSCLADDGTLADWVRPFLAAVPSYAEISPSGRGLKAFFYIAADDVRPFLDLVGIEATQWGLSRSIPGQRSKVDHGPGIELYTAGRFFTVTGNRWATQPDTVSLLDWPELEHLARLIPSPRSERAHKNGKQNADNSRSAIAFRKGAALRRAGRTFQEMCDALRADPETAEWCREKGDDNGARELYRIWNRAAHSDTKGTKPIVKVIGGNLPTVVDEAEEHLLASDHEIYQRGDFIVRPAMVPILISDNREALGMRLVPVKINHMVERFTKSVDFQKFDKRSNEWVSVDCPEKVAATYLERVGEWRLPILAGIVTAPTLRPDSSILDKPGYDSATGILYDPMGVNFGTISAEPTRADALVALEELKSLIGEFPFVGVGSRSVALSGILTTIVRRSIPRAPLHAFTAPDAGTGKSKLVDIASINGTGHEAPVIATGKTEEEMEKRLGAALIAGDAVISIDNVEHPLGGELLCQAITQPVLSIRILGKSEKVAIANNALFFANGNNLIIVGDAIRRALVGSLDAECERPELRKFKSEDPIETVKRERPRFVRAALTILRAFHVAGRPKQTTEPLGSFEIWSQWVRDALVWLGEEDPCATMERARSEDPKLATLAAVLRHWETAIGVDVALTTKQLIDRAIDTVLTADSDRRVFMHPDLREVLLSVAGERGNINSNRLGRWLRGVKGRVVRRKRIVLAKMLQGDNRWMLQAIDSQVDMVD